MHKVKKYLLVGIIVLATLIRMYKINTPLGDWHSFRQADTASVTREYIKNGIDLFHPKYHDISNIQSGKFNPQGYRMVEFPIVNALIALIYNLSGTSIPIHIFSRIFSIVFSLGSIIVLHQITANFLGRSRALAASLLFSIMPYNIYYSRVILPEVYLLFFSLLSMFLFIRYLKTQQLFILSLFVFFSAISLLIKPTAIFFLLPLIYLIWEKSPKEIFKIKWIFTSALIILPLILWRIWISNFAEGIPSFEWLLNGNNIRFTGAFFHWIFADRIGKLILGTWGTVFLIMGIGVKQKTNFFHIWGLSMLSYLFIFATGNVQHDYYQILLTPIIAVFSSLGLEWLLSVINKDLSSIRLRLLSICVLFFSLAFSWYHIRDFYNINNWAMIRAGEAVEAATEPEALIIAPYMGDTAFLYQTNRKGWPIGGNIVEKFSQGADYYVSLSEDEELKTLMLACSRIVNKTTEFTIIDLRSCNF